MRGALLPSHERDTILGLDIVRFAAALLVTCFHLGYWAWASPKSLPAAIAGVPFMPHSSLAWFGWVGVEIFFVLSGLLIARTADGRSALSFIKARIARLLPAVWICASVSLLVRLALGVGSPHELATAYGRTMLLLPLGPWIDPVYWTLAVEVIFYALVGGLLLVNRFDQVSRVFDSLALTSAAYWTIAILRPDMTAVWTWPVAGLLLLRHGCFFALGGMIWLVFVRGFGAGMIVRLAGTAVVCLAEIREASLGWQAHSGFGSPAVPMTVWTIAVVAIASAVRWKDADHTPRRAALARAVGLATFPLYLLHGVVGAATLRLTPLTEPARVVAAISLSIALAMLVSAFAEPRLRRLLRGTLDRVSGPLGRAIPLAARPTRPVIRGTTR